jgi:hypothetical protein
MSSFSFHQNTPFLSFVLILVVMLLVLAKHGRGPVDSRTRSPNLSEGFSLAAHIESAKPHLSVLHVSPRGRLAVEVSPAARRDSRLVSVFERISHLRDQGISLSEPAAGSVPERKLRVTNLFDVKKDDRILAVLPASSVLFLLSRPAGLGAPTSLSDLAGRTVSYETAAEASLLESLIPVGGPKLVKTSAGLDRLAGADAAAVLIDSPGSDVLSNEKVIVVAYDETRNIKDAHRMRVIEPRVHVQTVDVKAWFPKNVARRRAMALMTVPAVLVGPPALEVEAPDQLGLLLDVLIFTNDEVATNSYYEMLGSSYYDVAERHMRSKSGAIAAKAQVTSEPVLAVGRPVAPVLEQFDAGGSMHTPRPSIDVTAAEPLPEGTYVQHRPLQKVLIMKGTRLQGVPLLPGDRVRVQGQLREDDNGVYVVAGSRDGSVIMESPPWISASRARLAESRGDAWVLDVPVRFEAHKPLPGDRVLLRSFAKTYAPPSQHGRLATVVAPRAPGSRTLRVKLVEPAENDLMASYDLDKFHPLSICARDPRVNIRELCPGTWDRPCERDSDCPFFQANGRYPNYRGGCIAGFCELPIGLRPDGYRHFRTSRASFPMCHGCKDPDDPGCCAGQGREGRDPDYAFELDQFERLHSGLHGTKVEI